MYTGICVAVFLFAVLWACLPQELKEQTTLDDTNKPEDRPFGTYEVIGKVPIVSWTNGDDNIIQVQGEI